MKNLFYLSVLVLTAGLVACASDEINEDRNYQYANANQGGCGGALIPEARPAPVPAYAPSTPVVSNCGCNPVLPSCTCPQPKPACTCPSAVPSCGCPATEYTVRTPVQVVYQNTTYRTVYEPKTFQTTSYETRPYCGGGICR
jgi:hypothetical protein